MLNQKSNSKLLYHYTSAETLFLILEKMRLKVSKYQDANDLSEVGKFLGIDAFKSVATSNFIKEHCGYISFSQNYYLHEKGKQYPMEGYTILTMWAYYADRNRGACIVIDEDKFKHNNNLYKKNRWLHSVTYKRYVHKDEFEANEMSPEEIISTYHDQIFFHKQKSWSHEHEKRLCIVYPPDFLSIRDCVVSIVLGNRFAKSNMLRLISMLEDPNLDCYKQLNQWNFGLQSNLDGLSSTLDDPFIKLDSELIKINTFLKSEEV